LQLRLARRLLDTFLEAHLIAKTVGLEMGIRLALSDYPFYAGFVLAGWWAGRCGTAASR
jgi:hypothetical protein